MPWLRIDDGFTEHPKVVRLSNRAFRLHVEGLCYCARNVTDGFVPDGVCLAIRRRLSGDGRVRMTSVNQLVAGDLWAKIDGGYVIHDYLDYNPTAAEVKEKRASDAERQRRHRHGVTNAVTPNLSQRYVTPSRPVPKEEVEEENRDIPRGVTHPLTEMLRQAMGDE